MTYLELSDLVVGYGGNAVCAPVSLTLGAGDIVAVIGANGTGKSTLLRTVLGLQEPLSGTVGAFGRAVDERERCLLYTSPSPRDLSTSRMPSSA